MKTFYSFAFTLIAILSTTALSSQSIADYFSQEGLSINAYHFNFFDGTYNTSYTFLERTEDTSGDVFLKFIRNQYGSITTLRIVDKKVYIVNQNSPNDYLVYDFGVEVGDVITEGIYENFEVISIEPMTLLNGEMRNAYQLKRGSSEATVVEGIGDINSGLFPNFYDFEGYDVFVCAKMGEDLLLQNEVVEQGACDMYSCIWPMAEFEISIEDFEITTFNHSEYSSEYLWDFGDGNTSTEFNPIHTYEKPGCYTIILTVSNECYAGGIETSVFTNICMNRAWDHVYENDSMRFNIYPFDENTDYVYNTLHLFKVSADGSNWEKLTTTPEGEGQRSILTMQMWDENRGVAGCNNNNQGEDRRSILVTNDGGNSWVSKVNDSYWNSNLLLAEGGIGYVFRSVYVKYFYRTMDYGETWKTITFNEGPPWFGIRRFILAEDNLVYAQAFEGFWDDQDYRLGKSLDYGVTWEFIDLPFFGKQLQFIDENIGFGCDGYRVWETSDGGETWTKIDGAEGIDVIHFASATHGWFVDDFGVTHYTTDKFVTSSVTACGEEYLTNIIPISATTAVATRAFYNPTDDPGTDKFVFNIDKIGDCFSIVDADGDGYSADEDCDDDNASINPGQPEEPYNGIDDDCDTSTLDDDLDQDGFVLAEDCDDENASVNPDQTEEPYNGIDDDCDTSTLDDDLDQDGFVLAEDCDDENPLINTDAEEIPNNGIDEDCDGMDLITFTSDLVLENLSIHPNPFSSSISVFTDSNRDLDLKIYSILGEQIYQSIFKTNVQLDLSEELPGMYFMVLTDEEGKSITQRILKQ